MSSITVTLSGNSSILEADFFPPITLNDEYQYECGLTYFQTFNCVPNIDETNNKFVYSTLKNHIKFENGNESLVEAEKDFVVFDSQFYEKKVVTIPTGSYEIDDIYQFIKSNIDNNIQFEMRVNKNTLKCEIFSAVLIDFTHTNSIATLLGFSSHILKPNELHVSDQAIEINKINTIRVECSIITGSYYNNKSAHTIHEFFPTVEAGYKIAESPQNVIYLPITVGTIQNIGLKFIDQNNRLINFRGENIVTRLHIRRVRN